MRIQGKSVRITPQCVKNHGIENRVDYAFSLIRDSVVASLKGRPNDNIVINFFVETSSEGERRGDE